MTGTRAVGILRCRLSPPLGALGKGRPEGSPSPGWYPSSRATDQDIATGVLTGQPTTV